MRHVLELVDPRPATVPSSERADAVGLLSREVYCVLGIPINRVEMREVVSAIETASTQTAPFVLSTPNLNFLVQSQHDRDFRESLLASDLCPADGMPIIWIGKLIGLPHIRRIAGSDIFEALKGVSSRRQALKVVLFGSTETVAAAAAKAVSSKPTSMTCVGWICPGFGNLDELSAPELVEKVNASRADFLVVALGAQKGQLWLQRNHESLRIPVRAHLGATVNFQAGAVKRAPIVLQRCGLEWLWRIKEEPHLWKRYGVDGAVFIKMMLTQVLPLIIESWLLKSKLSTPGHTLAIETVQDKTSITLTISGFAVASELPSTIPTIVAALATGKALTLDFSQTSAIDQRFLGLLLMVRRLLKHRASQLRIVGLKRKVRRIFRLNGAGYLLTESEIA